MRGGGWVRVDLRDLSRPGLSSCPPATRLRAPRSSAPLFSVSPLARPLSLAAAPLASCPHPRCTRSSSSFLPSRLAVVSSLGSGRSYILPIALSCALGGSVLRFAALARPLLLLFSAPLRPSAGPSPAHPLLFSSSSTCVATVAARLSIPPPFSSFFPSSLLGTALRIASRPLPPLVVAAPVLVSLSPTPLTPPPASGTSSSALRASARSPPIPLVGGPRPSFFSSHPLFF